MVFQHCQGRRPGDCAELAEACVTGFSSPPSRADVRWRFRQTRTRSRRHLRVTAWPNRLHQVGSATTFLEAKRCVYEDSASWKPS